MSPRQMLLAATCLATLAVLRAQTVKAPDITKQPTLYVVPYAHLDTQWRWEFPQVHQRVPAENHAGEFRPHREVSALRLQLDRRQPLPPDEGIFPRGLRQGEEIRGTPADGIPAGSSMEEGDVNTAQRRGHHPPGALRQHLFPPGIRQGQRRIHAARLLRLPGLAAQHSGARRREGLLHAEAVVGLAAGAQGRRARFARADPVWAFRSTSASGKAPTARPSSPPSIPAATAATSRPTSARSRPPAAGGARRGELGEARRNSTAKSPASTPTTNMSAPATPAAPRRSTPSRMLEAIVTKSETVLPTGGRGGRGGPAPLPRRLRRPPPGESGRRPADT